MSKSSSLGCMGEGGGPSKGALSHAESGPQQRLPCGWTVPAAPPTMILFPVPGQTPASLVLRVRPTQGFPWKFCCPGPCPPSHPSRASYSRGRHPAGNISSPSPLSNLRPGVEQLATPWALSHPGFSLLGRPLKPRRERPPPPVMPRVRHQTVLPLFSCLTLKLRACEPLLFTGAGPAPLSLPRCPHGGSRDVTSLPWVRGWLGAQRGCCLCCRRQRSGHFGLGWAQTARHRSCRIDEWREALLLCKHAGLSFSPWDASSVPTGRTRGLA